MAGELLHPTGSTGQAYQAVLRNAAGQVWNADTSAFGAWSDGSIAAYGLPLTEQGASGHFTGNFPAAIVTAGLYAYTVYHLAGADLALTDSKAGLGSLAWDGTAEVLPGAEIEVDGKSQVEFYRLIGAVLLGRLSGAGTGTEVFRALDNSKARVTAEVSEAGDRSAVTLDDTP